jgi:hypothetical protein
VVRSVIPVTSGVLRPHLQELESRLKPGMVALTWSSMNIDSFKESAHAAIKVRAAGGGLRVGHCCVFAQVRTSALLRCACFLAMRGRVCL